MIATAAAVLLLSGCGSDDDSSSSSPASDSSSSASTSSSSADRSASSGDAEVAAFCAQAESFAQSAGELQNATPDTVVPVLQQTVTAFDDVEPPAEISGDWGVVGDALHSFSDTAGSLDVTSQEGATAFQQAADDFLGVFSGPEGTNVSDYVTSNCPGA